MSTLGNILCHLPCLGFFRTAGTFFIGTQSANKFLTVQHRGNPVSNYTYSGGDMEMRQNRFGKPGAL